MLKEITAGVAALKLATDVTKNLMNFKEVSQSGEAREMVAELRNHVADAKIVIADLKNALVERDEKILELEAKLKARQNLLRDGCLYFEKGKKGSIAGDPFCPRCFEVDEVRVHLIVQEGEGLVCPHCDRRFRE